MAKKNSTGKVAAEIGAGIAAVGAAAAAGYYFYGSDKAKNHRKVAAKWANDMKKEVVRQAKRAQDMSPKAFATVVDTVAATYAGARSVDAADLKRAAKELKANWEMVKKEVVGASRKTVSRAKTVTKRSVSSAKKSAKKAVKKTVKKASKKR